MRYTGCMIYGPNILRRNFVCTAMPRGASLAVLLAIGALIQQATFTAAAELKDRPSDPGYDRAAATEAELANLESALTFCAIDTDYFVSLESLDDHVFFPANPAYDYIDNGGGTFVMRPQKGTFDPPIPNFDNIWFGPYATYQSGRTQTGNTPYDQGSPLDQWNRPYYFFSPLGLIRGDTGAVTLELYGDQFDRYTIVTLGPDGVMSGDDYWRQMGVTVSQTAISSITGSGTSHLNSPGGTTFFSREGNTISIRGYFLGATQGSSRVLFGAAEFTNVISWSDNLVTVQIPDGLVGTDPLSIETSIRTSNPLTLVLLANGVDNWADYE